MNKGRGRVVWDIANRDHLVLDHPERKLSVTQMTECIRCTPDLPARRSVVSMSSNKVHDPYDEMPDSEFSDYVARLFDDQRRRPSTPVSLRMPSDLLQRVRRMADAGDVPYQQLMKKFIESGTTQLERQYERAKKAVKPKGRH